MKKLICVLLAAVMMAGILSGCGETFKCWVCGDKYPISEVNTAKLLDGEKVVYCDGCKDDMQSLLDMHDEIREYDKNH